MPADIEVGASCKPLICEIEECIAQCINDETEYSVGEQCGTDIEVTVSFSSIQPAPGQQKKIGGCGRGARLIAEINVVICVTECTDARCTAMTAHQKIDAAIHNSNCCTERIQFQRLERFGDTKGEDTVVATYLVIYRDPNAI